MTNSSTIRTRSGRLRRGIGLVAVVATAGAGAVSCTSDVDQATSAADPSFEQTGPAVAADQAPDGNEAASSATESSGGATANLTGANLAVTAIPVDRSIVYNATLSIHADDVSATSRRAREVVLGVGGYVFGQESDFDGRAQAVLTLKVPPDRLDATLDRLGELGTVKDQTLRADDVTAQVVDLDARLLSAQASVERVRGFLLRTNNIGEIAGIEAELTRRETEVEQLTGQRRQLGEQVAMATVTFTISTVPPVPAEPPPEPSKDVPGFASALGDGFGALVKVLRVVAAGAGYVLPFAVPLGLIGAFLWMRSRRSRSGLTAAFAVGSPGDPGVPSPG